MSDLEKTEIPENSENFEAMLKQFNQTRQASPVYGPRIGDLVRGTLIYIGEEYALIDLGAKAEGRLDLAVLKDSTGSLRYAVGDSLESLITGQDEESGMFLLGNQQNQRYHGQAELERAYRQGSPIEGQVTAVVKGGLTLQIAGMRAFCPASQVDSHFITDFTEFVGQRWTVRITKFEAGRRPNVIVSRRVLIEEQQKLQAVQTRAQLQEGAVLTGTVTALKEYGAFVDLGGVEGMIHISELTFGHVRHPREILEIGQKIEVSILRIEPGAGSNKRDKIALSIRALSRDPWLSVAQNFPVGAQVSGKVMRIESFGAFIELAPGVEGLLHISEISAGRRIAHPSEVIKSDEMITTTVLATDPQKRRIRLTLAAQINEGPSVQAPTVNSVKPAKDINSTENRKTSSPRTERNRTAVTKSPVTATPEKNVGSFGALLQESLHKKR